MVAEPWILRMGNQVSHNLKHALFLDPTNNSKKPEEQKEIIGILSFEVANIMSKTVHLHKSLTDREIAVLKNEILKSEGVRNLVSSDESYLLQLALAEKLDDLNRVASVVSRLGKKCTEPALQGFEHVYADVVSGVIGVGQLGFLVKDMDGMIRKMERYVSSTTNLYNEIQVLNELEEQTSKKFLLNQQEDSRRVFEQKLIWQRQDVRHLKDVSLWNQTYDKIVGLLARTLCTIFARICVVFGDCGVPTTGSMVLSGGEGSSQIQKSGLMSGSGLIMNGHCHSQLGSEPLHQTSSRDVMRDKIRTTASSELTLQRNMLTSFHQEDMRFPCGASPARLLLECLSLSSPASSKLDDEEVDREDSKSQTASYFNPGHELTRKQVLRSNCSNRIEKVLHVSGDERSTRGSQCVTPCRSKLGTKSRLLLHASPNTVGGSALALHYANVIIVIEKLHRYPHLVGDEARDDLYQMLPTSLRVAVRTNLKSYVKSMGIYDAPLAHEWKETLDKLLKWLAPLAHNMIRWQTERNLEQQQIITRTNVLLLHTVYFADREKTETAICELLVGLNYICRYEQQQNALLDCASSFDFDDCMEEWRWQDHFL